MRVEYDIVWNGAHRDCDADLLAAPPVVKRTPPAIDQAPTVTDDVVATLRAQPCLTMAEIATALGLTTQAVNGALYTLRKSGVVDVVETPLRRPWGGALYRYRLIETRPDDRAWGQRARPSRQPRVPGAARGGRSSEKADRSVRRRRVPARS